MFLTEQTVLMIQVCFLQNVYTVIILFKVKCFFRNRNKILAAATKINTYYRLSGAIQNIFLFKNDSLLMILRASPLVFCPLPTNILKINSDQVGLFFKRDFVSA